MNFVLRLLLIVVLVIGYVLELDHYLFNKILIVFFILFKNNFAKNIIKLGFSILFTSSGIYLLLIICLSIFNFKLKFLGVTHKRLICISRLLKFL